MRISGFHSFHMNNLSRLTSRGLPGPAPRPRDLLLAQKVPWISKRAPQAACARFFDGVRPNSRPSTSHGPDQTGSDPLAVEKSCSKRLMGPRYVKRITNKEITALAFFWIFDFDFQTRKPIWFLTFWREGAMCLEGTCLARPFEKGLGCRGLWTRQRPVAPSDGQLRTPHEGRRQKGKNQASGRRFFWALFFGRAKKSATGPGRSAWSGGIGGMNPPDIAGVRGRSPRELNK